MMKPTTPIDAYISFATEQYVSSINRPSTRVLAELIQTAETRTVTTFAHVELVLLLRIGNDLLTLLVLQQQHIVGVAEAITT